MQVRETRSLRQRAQFLMQRDLHSYPLSSLQLEILEKRNLLTSSSLTSGDPNGSDEEISVDQYNCVEIELDEFR